MKLFEKQFAAVRERHLREICECTLRHRESSGWIYRNGVVDEAVRRATGAKGDEALINAIEAAFVEYEIGNRNYGHTRFVA